MENKTSKNLPGSKSLYEKLLLKYMHIAYVIGKRIEKGNHKKISGMLYQADLDITPGMFISLFLLTAFISAMVMFIVSNLILAILLKSFIAFPLAMLISCVTFAAVVGAAFFYLINIISTKKIEIERDLPFALSYMSIMASAGSTPLKVISDTSVQNYRYVSSEFGKMTYRVYFLGEDSITAINHLANNTPSAIFRDICLDLSNIIRSGTGLSEYLADKSTNLIDIKKIALKAFMEDIAMFAEVYIMISMFTMLAITAIPLINIFGVGIASLSAGAMFIIVTYILTPFINILFIAMLESKYSSIP
jgi:flagellar protein FlaJ